MAKKASKPKAAKKETRSTAPARKVAGVPEPPTPKAEAIHIAVRRQLEADGHWHLAHDLAKVMGSDYHYDEEAMRGFLYGIHRILANGTPPYTFEYDAQFVTAALGLNAPALISAIDRATA